MENNRITEILISYGIPPSKLYNRAIQAILKEEMASLVIEQVKYTEPFDEGRMDVIDIGEEALAKLTFKT